MTTTINISGYFQWTAANQVGLNTGTSGSPTQPNEYTLFMIGANNTLINTGAILNGSGQGDAAVGIRGNNEVITNAASAVLAGYSSDTNGIYGYGIGTSITNFGTIKGGGHYGAAVHLSHGGFVSNASTGTLSGAGIIMTYGAGTIVNAGHILGDSTFGAIFLGAGGQITNLTGGTITANGATSSTYGAPYGVFITGAAGTITNTGTISGGTTGYAVEMAAGYANRVIVDQGGVFIGTVSGGSASDGSTLELTSFAGQGTISGFGTSFTNFGTVAFDASASWLLQTNTAAISAAVIDGFVSTDTIDIVGFTATSIQPIDGGTGVVLTDAASHDVTLHFGGAIGNFGYTTGAFGTELTTVCFCVGTLIDTPDGEVQVEKLAAGDLVLTAHNGPRRVKWIGHGRVLATRGKRTAATPVIVRKGALADNVPNQDLHVTKAHSLYIDNVLIPVEFLVNHKTILWDDRAQEVEIYHVELDSHDVLLANGAAAESYRDDGNRWLFQNANSGWDGPPQEPCAPVLTGGKVVDAVWQRLVDRAGPRRLPPMTDDPDLHLIVDGQRVEAAERTGLVFVFRLARRPGSVHLVSREVVPAELGLARDPRSLGVALRLMTVRQGARFEMLRAGDPRLTEGFHDYEETDRLRWTNGHAVLPLASFARFTGAMELVLTLAQTTAYPDDGARCAAA